MGYKALRDLALEKGVHIRSLQTHVKNHESELEGHIIRYGPPRGTYVDEYAEEFISGLLVGHPIATADPSLIAENERLKDEIVDLQKKLIQLQDEKAGLLERALEAENRRELVETTVTAAEEKILRLESDVRELTEANRKLKSRSLWQRIIRFGED